MNYEEKRAALIAIMHEFAADDDRRAKIEPGLYAEWVLAGENWAVEINAFVASSGAARKELATIARDARSLKGDLLKSSGAAREVLGDSALGLGDRLGGLIAQAESEAAESIAARVAWFRKPNAATTIALAAKPVYQHLTGRAANRSNNRWQFQHFLREIFRILDIDEKAVPRAAREATSLSVDETSGLSD